ncbi:MAG: hypothetical protein WCX65_09745 [bacterium]
MVYSLPQILEAVMLACFGASWPFSIFHMIKTQRTEGKSAVFVVLVLIGYVTGLAGKLTMAAVTGTKPQMVTILYAFNTVLVAMDLILFVRLKKKCCNE